MGLNKPAKLPRWADDGGTIEEPSEAKKDVGFIAERPTFGAFNWLLNLIYQWLDFFDKTSTTQEDGIISGAAKTSGFPLYLSAGATTRRFTILATSTPLVLQIDGVRYKLESDLTLGSDLALAPSSNNTGTVGEGDGSASTCYRGEYGGRIDLSGVPGSEIEAAEAVIQAYKITNGGNSEICLARYTTTDVADPGYHFMPLIRGIAGTDRQPLTNASTTITILKAHWIFLNKDMTTIKTTENCPAYGVSAPGSPATDDFWFDSDAKSWARYDGADWVYENYAYLGIAICDSSNCIAVECIDFVGIAWDETISYKVMKKDRYASNLAPNYDDIRIIGPGEISVAGTMVHLGEETMVYGDSTESGNGGWPWFYVYLKPDGTIQCSPKGPRKKDFRKGWYHPSEYWRCIGLYMRNLYGDSFCDYDPESGLLQMTYRNDIGSGEPGVIGFNFLTSLSIDSPGIADTSYMNIPPIVREVNARVKAYATAGTVPNDAYIRPPQNSFMYHGYAPLITVNALNVMQTSFPTLMVECCVVTGLAWFDGSTTNPPTLSTFKMHIGSARIRL